jgi:surface antigen
MRSIFRAARLAAPVLCSLALLPSTGLAQEAMEAPDLRVSPETRAIRGTAPAWRLDEMDEIATLEAIRVALTEVGDGGAYAWYRENGHLNGVVNPTSSFKDGKGRICRHIVLILSAGAQTGKVEGIACRGPDGRWSLDG